MRMEAGEAKRVLIEGEMKKGRTLAQALEIVKKKQPELFEDKKSSKKLKHGNIITSINGIKFRSKKEANYYCKSKLRLQAGEIIGIVLQPKFILQEGNEKERPITYSADFLLIYPDMTCEVIDTKGYSEDAGWKRTYKMFRIKYPHIELKVVK